MIDNITTHWDELKSLFGVYFRGFRDIRGHGDT